MVRSAARPGLASDWSGEILSMRRLACASETVNLAVFPMKALACLIILLVGALASRPAPVPATGTEVLFTVQLIRGTDHAKPEVPTWKPLEPKLKARLVPCFRWSHWWEVATAQTNIAVGKTRRIRLSADREIDIARHSVSETEVRLYQKGVLAQKSRRSSQSGQWIMGGTRQNDESWFIVVTPPKTSHDADVVRQ